MLCVTDVMAGLHRLHPSIASHGITRHQPVARRVGALNPHFHTVLLSLYSLVLHDTHLNKTSSKFLKTTYLPSKLPHISSTTPSREYNENRRNPAAKRVYPRKTQFLHANRQRRRRGRTLYMRQAQWQSHEQCQQSWEDQPSTKKTADTVLTTCQIKDRRGQKVLLRYWEFDVYVLSIYRTLRFPAEEMPRGRLRGLRAYTRTPHEE